MLAHLVVSLWVQSVGRKEGLHIPSAWPRKIRGKVKLSYNYDYSLPVSTEFYAQEKAPRSAHVVTGFRLFFIDKDLQFYD